VNFELIGHLIGLRYKLLWAKTRTRNGKIALFIIGYLLLMLLGGYFAAGGISAGAIAIRAGKAEPIAQGVLTALFAMAVITSLTLGFGVNQAFSETELRRYPLTAPERLFARHFTGMADPFWFLFLTLEIGLAVGLYLFGASSLLLGIFGVLLLFVCNYMAAQAAGLVIARVEQHRRGSILLPLGFMALCLTPGMLAPVLRRNPRAVSALVNALSLTPGFGAGSIMTRAGLPVLHGFLILALWMLGLTAIVVLLEKQPVKAQPAEKSSIRWDTLYNRVGMAFGPTDGPMVAHWLQFYARCKRFRISYLISLPLIPFLIFMWTKQAGVRGNPFGAALGVMAISGMAPAAAFIVNQFGYVGGGFRRYFLFPTDPAAALRTSSFALMALCLPPLSMAIVFGVIFSFQTYGAQGALMLTSSAVFGLFAFHAAGLWTTLYGARRCDPDKTMGNDLSAMGNSVVVGGMLVLLIGMNIVGQFWKNAVSPDHWWVVLLIALAAAGFYFSSLKRATSILNARRELLLGIVEGKG
jgi:hypothetical protein